MKWTFPEAHPNPILKGKKVEFRIKVKDIKERVLAELDDEFAKDAGEEFNTLEDLKASIRERLTKQREERAEGTVTDRIMQKLLANHDFEVPKRLVAFEIEQMIKQTEQQFEKNGMSLEAAGLSREKLAEQNEEMAKKRVRGDFILKKIAEVEEIKLADEDMDRGFKRIGDMYNMPVAKVKEYFPEPRRSSALHERIAERKNPGLSSGSRRCLSRRAPKPGTLMVEEVRCRKLIEALASGGKILIMGMLTVAEPHWICFKGLYEQ